MTETWDADINGKRFKLRVLRSSAEHTKGYQYCKTEPKNNVGLLFLFTDNHPRAFHMRNVPFNLRLLGYNEDGENVCDQIMLANDKKIYSTEPCKFVVEIAENLAKNIPSGASLRIISF